MVDVFRTRSLCENSVDIYSFDLPSEFALCCVLLLTECFNARICVVCYCLVCCSPYQPNFGHLVFMLLTHTQVTIILLFCGHPLAWTFTLVSRPAFVDPVRFGDSALLPAFRSGGRTLYTVRAGLEAVGLATPGMPGGSAAGGAAAAAASDVTTAATPKPAGYVFFFF